jgi:hypothetical protein
MKSKTILRLCEGFVKVTVKFSACSCLAIRIGKI